MSHYIFARLPGSALRCTLAALAVCVASRADAPEGGWVRNPVDTFVLDSMRQHGVSPSPEADRYTLVRRAHLDLLGLPPSPTEVEAFVNDPDPQAYDKLIDRLLASPHYGERMAVRWLDAARYADTNGYEKDRPRPVWPYRDWVIRAFNDNMPFDRFVIEQLAGDLLPGATEAQRVATGFLRNSMHNEEGGVDAEEFRYEAMVDRTNTVSTVFLGLTMACAQCHSHKYDPLTQREYFQFYAFLNNTDDVEMEVHDAAVAKERDALETKIAALVEELPNRFPAGEMQGETSAAHLVRKFAAWEGEVASRAAHWTALDPVEFTSKYHATLVRMPDQSILVKGDVPNTDTYEVSYRANLAGITAIRIEVLPDPSLPNGGPGRGVIMSPGGDFLLSEIAATDAPWLQPDQVQQVTLQNATEDFAAEGRAAQFALDGKLDTGWSIKGQEGKPHAAVFEFAAPVTHEGGTLLRLKLDQYYVHQHTIGRFRVSVTSAPLPVKASGVPSDIESIVLTPQAERSAEQSEQLKRYYLSIAPELTEAHKEIEAMRASMPRMPRTLVLEERETPRVTHIQHRGEFLQPREAVTPGVPAVLNSLPAEAPPNRLTLARWLVSEENPLTARVTVNRFWDMLFGRGIVPTPEDFGTRGEEPSHPELLDWLAVEFERSGWDVKAMLRLIMTSAAYRQSSRITPELLASDPSNEWLARCPRVRVEAEFIRDIALSASGLLSAKMGGPSVKPPLPEGAMSLVYPGDPWTVAEGEDRYRRGVYTYWKRTLPYPTAMVFDAAARDTTCVRRIRSNTPLQALTMLNDAQMMEASRAMAQRVLQEAPADMPSRIAYAFMLALSRPPDADEQTWITDFYEQQRARFDSGQSDATVIFVTDTPAEDTTERAAWTLICRALLNTDEAITKQ
ncbi:MAG: DUF1553 domain-containing protein [Candidatus Hydrogenedentes bacterium]|nr:DUF1553 domain-containing protein [Candidatus Hydrogenedentota bacterium]